MNFHALARAIYLTALFESQKRQWFELNKRDLQRQWWLLSGQPKDLSDLAWKADLIATRHVAERFAPVQRAAE